MRPPKVASCMSAWASWRPMRCDSRLHFTPRRLNSMSYRYYTCDVFTDRRFGGNQLAVLPRADGLSDQRMQQVAREFNFSETTFVLPSQPPYTRRVRIFTPTKEIPFAGHP